MPRQGFADEIVQALGDLPALTLLDEHQFLGQGRQLPLVRTGSRVPGCLRMVTS